MGCERSICLMLLISDFSRVESGLSLSANMPPYLILGLTQIRYPPILGSDTASPRRNSGKCSTNYGHLSTPLKQTPNEQASKHLWGVELLEQTSGQSSRCKLDTSLIMKHCQYTAENCLHFLQKGRTNVIFSPRQYEKQNTFLLVFCHNCSGHEST